MNYFRNKTCFIRIKKIKKKRRLNLIKSRKNSKILTVYVVVGIVGNEPLSFPSASFKAKKVKEKNKIK